MRSRRPLDEARGPSSVRAEAEGAAAVLRLRAFALAAPGPSAVAKDGVPGVHMSRLPPG